VIAFMMTQNDFSDKGMPHGSANALQPEFDLQMKYKNDKGMFAALTIGYKSLRPSLFEERDEEGEKKKYISKQSVNSAYVAGSFRKKFKPFTFKAEAIYGGAMTNVVMLGGVAEKAGDSEEREYTPLKNLSLWSDIHTNHTIVQPGILLGYSKNFGASEKANILPEYSLGADIGNMYTSAPRLRFLAMPKIWIGVEWMYTVAAYAGKDNEGKVKYDEYAKPIDLMSVANSRLTTSVRYTF
jgi:hypothetical protein